MRIYRLIECAFDSVVDGSAAHNDGSLAAEKPISVGPNHHSDITKDTAKVNGVFSATSFSHNLSVISDHLIAF